MKRRTLLKQCTALTVFTTGMSVGGAAEQDERIDCPPAKDSQTSEEREVSVPAEVGGTLGYYFPAGMDPADAPIEMLSDICYHALDIDGNGEPITRGDEQELAAIAEQAASVGTLPHLQVGGMEVDFAPAVEDPHVFAEGAVEIMEQYGYRGLSIDWEYPENGDEFASVMEAVREELDNRGDYHLGTAVSAVPFIADGIYAMDEVAPLLEYALVMSYDFTGPWSDRTGHNAALRSTETATLSVESAIAYWRDSALEDDQLLAGVPLYGYEFDGVSSDNGGYAQPFNNGVGRTYPDVKAFLHGDAVDVHFDEAAGVSYAYSAADETFLSLETPESAAAKAALARTQIRGVGMWAINQDVDAELISAVANST